ncbi:FAD-dependent oxidoreductase [Streptomyces mobaraensis]|uniref:FAD-dependent oxidoreductase n=1 Tax=Streptomyces mobaraensis TaxID=35621 RepID=A0A5N5W0W3_STRMB|nr:FAD-dependent oxidoreductase [Streptomyces mobaraensis]KAB7834316.1 FAD-dependent oxidoreductase [Streptomyces mobaraensis]
MAHPSGPSGPLLRGEPESYWLSTAPASPDSAYPPLTGTGTDVDVAVIGGGVAGLSTAWELARAGRSVAVLEAGRIAAGVTGHTTAKVTALHGLVYARLRRTRGPEGARLYARSQAEAVERVAEVAALLEADCELERRPAFTYVTRPEGRGEVREEANAAAQAGLDATYVERTGLPYRVEAAVRLDDQLQFHPRKYLLALARDLVARGGALHEHTRVTGLDEGTPCRVTTADGAVLTARDVVVATHYPVFDRALLFARLSPRRELVVTGTVPADQDPGGMYITSEGGTRSVRSAPYGDGRRLLIVTGESFKPGTADVAARFERLAAWARERFPSIAFDRHWATQDNDSTDTVPLVGAFHPRARHTWVATGFGGWGMSGGVMAGRLLTELIGGRRPPWADLYDPRRLWTQVREAPAFLRHQTEVARHFVGDRLRPGGADAVAGIAPGTGEVVRVHGRHCAVYRDEDGTAHAVSARCTHLGCLVAFNAAERAWECPCHGSRFAPDGAVLQGPAVRPLERWEVGE